MTRPRTYMTVELAEISGPSDRLKRWIRSYEVFHLTRSLEATDYRVVLTWIRSRNARPPALKTVQKIMLFSEKFPMGIGPLEYEDFFGKPQAKSWAEHAVRKSMTDPRQILTRRAI